MSLKVSAAAVMAYDTLKARARVRSPRAGARDRAGIDLVETKLREMIEVGRLGGHEGQGGVPYVFWTEVDALLASGALDDILERL